MHTSWQAIYKLEQHLDYIRYLRKVNSSPILKKIRLHFQEIIMEELQQRTFFLSSWHKHALVSLFLRYHQSLNFQQKGTDDAKSR